MKEEMPAIPAGFKAEMIEQFGEEEGTKLVESLDTPPSVSLRLNSRKVGRAPLSDEPYPDLKPVEWAEGGYRLDVRPRFTNHPWLHGGGFYVQEAASMWISTLIKRIKEEEGEGGLRVLDLCGAPGGKSIGVIEELPEKSVIVSNELIGQRAAVLRENIIKWGYTGSIVTSSSAAEFGKMEGWFDLIVVDAPCSGEGMMRKEAVARTQWSPRLVEQCAALQKEILVDVIPALRPGGWLIYSTCTFNRQEDEENIGWLENQGFKVIEGPRRFTPLRDGTEGLFMALLKKGGESETNYGGKRLTSNKGNSKKSKGGKPRLDPKQEAELRSWIQDGKAWDLKEENGKIVAVSEEVKETLSNLPKGVRILNAGIEMAEIKGKDLVPSHALALSLNLNDTRFPDRELTLEEAQNYLLREVLPPEEGAEKGYSTVSYKGVKLGWIKNLGNRVNNLYPKEWKIRSLGD